MKRMWKLFRFCYAVGRVCTVELLGILGRKK